MIKKIYIFLMVMYSIINISYFYSFEISYRIVKVRPELVEERSLTYEESKALDRAFLIRIKISQVFLIFSIFMALISWVLLYFGLFPSTITLKIFLGLSLFWSVVLILVFGINFIALPPLV